MHRITDGEPEELVYFEMFCGLGILAEEARGKIAEAKAQPHSPWRKALM